MMSDTKQIIVPLNGANYATWKIQCKMALIKEASWNIVNGSEVSPDPGADRNVYTKYVTRRDRALATIVLSVEPSLLYLLGDPEHPAIVWRQLQDQFQKRTWANKLALRKKLYSLKLKDTNSVQNHIKEMSEIFEELAVIGDPISEEDRVVHLLASLPDSYDMLVTALEVNEDVPKWVTVTERLLYEETKIKTKENRSETKALMLSKQHTTKWRPRCYFCNEFGHIQRFCPKRCEETRDTRFRRDTNYSEGKSCNMMEVEKDSSSSEENVVGLFVNDGSFIESKSGDWIVDSGSSSHMCFDFSKFVDFKNFDVSEKITLGDGYSVEALGKGTIELILRVSAGKQQRCNLYETLYVPNLSYNLLSVAKATSQGTTFVFDESKCQIIKNRKTIGAATKFGNLYYLNCVEKRTAHAAAYCSNGDTHEEIWHRRYGHLGAENLQKLVRDKLVDGFNYNASRQIGFCEPCVDGKHHRSSFPKGGGNRSNDLLGIVHSDVCGRIETKSLGGAEYFVTFIDDKSRFVWVYVLKHKGEVFEKFIEWKNMMEKSSGQKIKVLRTDNGGEYTSKVFENFLKKEGIRHEYTVPKTPEQNGVAERFNRTLVETVRAMLSDSNLPKRFWAEALSTATYIRNRSPTNAVQGKTPYEVLKGYKPNVKHLRVFGCSAYAHIPKDERRKMDSKAKRSIFLGYGIGIKGYRLYDTENLKVFHSRDVIFDETKSTDGQKEGQIAREVKNQSVMELEDQNISEDGDSPQPQESTIPRRSTRIGKRPDQYGEWIYIAHGLSDPLTVEQALSSPDKNEWRRAMEREIDSLHTNEVWDLVELPSGRKAIGSKWVFKRKLNTGGDVERYKARLVAQGFSQKYGVDYDETFCPVVRFESVRTLIALAAKNDLELHQLDITTAFLNGELKEEIYMKQPEEFVLKGKEHLVCKLKRSIYGLKQSPRC